MARLLVLTKFLTNSSSPNPANQVNERTCLERGLLQSACQSIEQSGFASSRGPQQQCDAPWPQASTHVIQDPEAMLVRLHQAEGLKYTLQPQEANHPWQHRRLRGITVFCVIHPKGYSCSSCNQQKASDCKNVMQAHEQADQSTTVRSSCTLQLP